MTVCTGMSGSSLQPGAAVMPQPALLLGPLQFFGLLIGLLHRHTGIGVVALHSNSVLVPAQPESNKAPAEE